MFYNFFGNYAPFLVIIHVLAVIVGMGAAIVSDVLFNVYISDKKINPTENKTLQVLSVIIWISLACIVLSGLAIFISDPLKYIHSPKFLLKMLVVFIIIINGYLFWKITHKSLKKINFTDVNTSHRYVRIRKLSFAFGAISLISWMFAFILGSIEFISISFSVTSGIYVLCIIFAIIGSQIAEYLITHKK